MKSDAISVLNDLELLDVRDRHFARMEDIYEGTDSGERAFGMYGIGQGVDAGDDPEAEIAKALDELAVHADEAKDPEVFRPLHLDLGFYGVHFVDRFFGANMEGWHSGTVENPVGELPAPDLDKDETWRLTKQTVHAFLDSGVKVPLLSVPCVSSALNEAINLYGEEFLLALMLEPEAARRDLRVINDVLVEMHTWYRDTIPVDQLEFPAARVRVQPPGYCQMDGCSTHLLSPEVYRDFIAELDDEIFSLYPKGGMMHLCGKHTQHLPVWREMKSLRAIQLAYPAEDDIEEYFNGSRSDQILYAGPCSNISMDRIMAATGGHRLIIPADVTPPLPRKRKKNK